MKREFLSAFMLASLLSGCVSLNERVTAEQLKGAQAAVEAAESLNAKSFAPEDLRYAQDAFTLAKDAFAQKEFQRALTFSRRAALYARLAAVKTDQKNAENRLSQAVAEGNSLQKEIVILEGALPTPAPVLSATVTATITPTAVLVTGSPTVTPIALTPEKGL